MRLCIIASVSRNGVIGNEGKLPWHLPDDLKRFKELTLGKPVIMGRKTFESLGKILPERLNIVLSRDPNYPPDRFAGEELLLVARDPAEALREARGRGMEVFVIGGQKVFEIFLPLADTLYLTLVEADTQGDSFFPPYKHLGFRETERTFHPKDPRHAFSFSFVIFERERDV